MRRTLALACFVLASLNLAYQRGWLPEVLVPQLTPATAAAYVYEKDDTAVPSGVSMGLDRLNREKHIPATLFEEDTLDGEGQVPDQYKIPLAEAQKAGLPALVVMGGDRVLNVVKAPTTAEQVTGAVR